VFVCPAVFAGFAEFVAGVFGLFAFPAMVFGGFVDAMVGFAQAFLTFAFIGAE
jgi:hypothetical protein